MTSKASQQIGHLLYELDQLHNQMLVTGIDAHRLSQLEGQIHHLCSGTDRARMLKMSRSYRALTALSRA